MGLRAVSICCLCPWVWVGPPNASPPVIHPHLTLCHIFPTLSDPKGTHDMHRDLRHGPARLKGSSRLLYLYPPPPVALSMVSRHP